MPKAQDRLVKDRSRVRERRLPDAPETPCGCRTADVACATNLALFVCSSAQVARRRAEMSREYQRLTFCDMQRGS